MNQLGDDVVRGALPGEHSLVVTRVAAAAGDRFGSHLLPQIVHIPLGKASWMFVGGSGDQH